MFTALSNNKRQSVHTAKHFNKLVFMKKEITDHS